MARSKTTSNLTQASLVVYDDEAIGPNANYSEYLQTFNEALLDLQGTPSRYYIRGMDLATNLALDTFTAGIAFTDEDDTRNYQKVIHCGRDATGLMVDQCVVGFDEHVYTRGVDHAGKPDEVVLRWPVGTPRPEGAREALMVDTTLMSALMRGLYNLARLTSREKEPVPRM